MTQPSLSGDPAPNFGLIGESPEILRVVRTINKLADVVSPVLITGESGVGKELVARALHRCSPLADKVFLPVDSATLVGSLMESEMFGHLKGAFTGALENKLGLVRAAEGGVLFLDEIGELSLDVQAKLLRLLQEGEVRPVGAVKPIQVNVRILAATNRDLETAVRSRLFRKDLYYRLNVIGLKIPPLRERRRDIPLLAKHFLERYKTLDLHLSPEVLRAFCEYDWPGNIRELENTVRGLVAIKSSSEIEVLDLPSPLRAFADYLKNGSSAPTDGILPLAEVERRHILHTVEFTKGDMTAAAHMLGIGRTTLYRKLKSYRHKVKRPERSEESNRQQRLFA